VGLKSSEGEVAQFLTAFVAPAPLQLDRRATNQYRGFSISLVDVEWQLSGHATVFDMIECAFEIERMFGNQGTLGPQAWAAGVINRLCEPQADPGESPTQA
jgi:hypothetical protein